MAFTRFHDDPCRIKKRLQESTDQGRYILDVPGNGSTPYYIDDPHLRLQKWGGNLMTDSINIENDLKGLTRSINQDCLLKNNYKMHAANTSTVQYPNIGTITDQSRATHPAWMSRDLEQVNWYILPLNPQENTCMQFQNNLNTRIIEKDQYIANYPCIEQNKNIDNPNRLPDFNNMNIFTSKF
jgi:hypothetical protein